MACSALADAAHGAAARGFVGGANVQGVVPAGACARVHARNART